MENVYVGVGDYVLTIPLQTAQKSRLIRGFLEQGYTGSREEPIPLSVNFEVSKDDLTVIQGVFAEDFETIFQTIKTTVTPDRQSFLSQVGTPRSDNIISNIKALMNVSIVKFFDYIGYDCGLGYLSYGAQYLISLGDWQNFNLLYQITRFFTNKDALCTTWKPLSEYNLKVLVLNAIMTFTDYKSASSQYLDLEKKETPQQDRCSLFECLIRGYFDETQDFNDRLQFVNVVECSDLSTCSGKWTDELLLLPYESSDFVKNFNSQTDNIFSGFDWENICVTGETVAEILTGKSPSHIFMAVYGNKEERVLALQKFLMHVGDELVTHGMQVHEHSVHVYVRGKGWDRVIPGHGGGRFVVRFYPHVTRYNVSQNTLLSNEECIFDGSQILMSYPCTNSFATNTLAVYSNYHGFYEPGIDDTGYVSHGFDTVHRKKYTRIISTPRSGTTMSTDNISQILINVKGRNPGNGGERDMSGYIVQDMVESIIYDKIGNRDLNVGMVTGIKGQEITFDRGVNLLLPHYSGSQIFSSSGHQIDLGDILPGDILEYVRSDNFSRQENLGLYINRSLYGIPKWMETPSDVPEELNTEDEPD